jgi:hypothetical protein
MGNLETKILSSWKKHSSIKTRVDENTMEGFEAPLDFKLV